MSVHPESPLGPNLPVHHPLPTTAPAGGADGHKGGFRIRNMLPTVKRTILEAGSNVGKYRIIEEVDRGGMAVVYKAMQLDLKREVALKVMPANVTVNYRFVERFLAEAHSVAKLSHPYIVNIYEVAAEGDIYYIAMEYVAGKNLFRHLNENKPKLVDVLEIVSKLTEALSYAHGEKIIHRDLKLNNAIMKDPLTPVLIDFGLAKALEDSDTGGGITRTGEIMGSPAYMAPERLLGEPVDHRSDICSLGIMLYEMLTFKNPYLDQRNLHQTTYNVMEANPIPPRKLIPWLPQEVEAITLRAMAKDPAMRYQSMDEFRADIQRYQKGETVLAKPPSLKKRTVRFLHRKWAPIAISFVIMLLSALLAVNHYIQRKDVLSHWQLVYTQPVQPTRDEWTFEDADSELPGEFSTSSRAVTIAAHGLSFARLEQRFNRDIRIEFDVRSNSRNVFKAGVFLYGDSPEGSMRVHLNHDGFGGAGISYPGQDIIIQEIESGAIPWRAVNAVSIERIQNTVTLTINGTMVSQIFDYFPPIGKAHEHVGFYVNGSEATFANIRIHRRTIPLMPSPTLIPDRFWERGDFEAAIDEYNSLMVDQTALNMVKDIHIRIADCQLRLGLYRDALNTLDRSARMNSSEALRARSQYLRGLAHKFMGDSARADDIFLSIAREFRYSPVNFPIMAEALAKTSAKIDVGEFDSAIEDIKKFTRIYPRYAHHWGTQHLRILNTYSKDGELERCVRMAEEIAALYRDNSNITERARIILAEAYLNVGQIMTANDIYNQSIHTKNITDAIWQAWFALADLYEYDFNYKYAQDLYTKIWRESPKTSMTHWMAAIKCAERQIYASDTVQLHHVPLLHEIVSGDHPFPLPRMIAAYYTDQITEIEFMNQWETLFPTFEDEIWSLYYIARKLLLQGNREEAISVITVLQRQYSTTSWRLFQVQRILQNEASWM